MNKKLLALAVAAAVSAPALVLADDSTVTLYGTLNIDFENVKAEGATGAGINLPSRNKVSQNSSNIGFRGIEPLGGGLNAIFQIESGVSLDTGQVNAGGGNGTSFGTFASRNSNVGLSGGFGTIFFGNWDTPYKTSTLPIDAYYATGIAYYVNVLSGNSTPTNTNAQARNAFDRRQNNSVQYWTPDLSGFRGRIAYSANEQKSATGAAIASDPKLYSLSGTYSNGPLLLTLTYEKHDQYANLATVQTDDKGVKAGAQYTFPTATTVGVIYERLTFNGNIGATGLPKALVDSNGAPLTAAQIAAANDAKIDAYYLSVRQAFGPHTIRADYGADRGLKIDGSNASQSKAKTFAIGYSYSFSKRTDVYALYTKITNDINSRNDFSVNAIGGVANGADPQGYGIGIRHVF